MKRLLTFLYLLTGLIFLGKGAEAQSEPSTGTPFMNLPDTTCWKSFASMNAFYWKSSNTPDSATWTITPGGSSITVLYSSDNTNKLVRQKPDPTYKRNALTIKFNDIGQYTVSVALWYNGVKSVVTKKIYSKDCSILPCQGKNTGLGDFKEDFGNFKNGATTSKSSSYVTGYVYNPLPLASPYTMDDNSYTVFWNTQVRSEWVSMTDHTGSTVDSVGGMLIANSSYDARSFFTRDNVPVCPGSLYNFSAWFLNVNGIKVFNSSCINGNWDGYHYAGVSFLIINTKGGAPSSTWDTLARFKTFDVSMNLSGPQWQMYGGGFKTPGGVTSVRLEIVNDRPGGCGNDIAVDDISFAYCSPYIYSYIDGKLGLRADSLCDGAPVTMKASYSPNGWQPDGTYDATKDYFKNPQYQWFSSNDGVTWDTLHDGSGISGTMTSSVVFAPGALKGDPNQIVTKYYRVNILEKGNLGNCAAPSEYTKITILPKPKVTVSSGRICIGDSVVMTANGGYSEYEWQVNPVVTGPIMTVYPTVTSTYSAIGIADYGWDAVKMEQRQCRDTGSAQVIVDAQPVTKISGGPTDICLGQQIKLNVTNSGAPPDSLAWSWKYNTTSIGNPNDVSITHIPSAVGTQNYSVLLTNKTCTAVDTFKVNVRSLPKADTAITYKQCNIPDFAVTRTALPTSPSDQQGKWLVYRDTQNNTSGITFTNPTSNNTTVKGIPTGDTVTVIWVITNKSLAACTDTSWVTLINTKPLTPSVAGASQAQCGINLFQLGANKPGPGEKGRWTLGTGTTAAMVTIDDSTAYNAKATIIAAAPQTVQLIWTISNGVCSNPTSSVVKLTLKNPPAVNITAAAVCNTVAFFTINYSGLTDTIKSYEIVAAPTRPMPNFTKVTGTWPVGSASGTSNINLPANTPAGVYDFILTGKVDTLHGCTVSVPFSLSVEKPSTNPTAVTASTTSLCVKGDVTLTVVGGSLGMDSTKTPATWKWYTGACPGTPGSTRVYPTSSNTDSSIVTFKNVTATTTYYVMAPSAGPCGNTTCASVTVTVYAQPNNANASTDQAECERKTAFQLNGNTPTPATAIGIWTSTNPRVTIYSATQANATVLVPVGDTASLIWTISNGPCKSTTDTVFITNYKKPVAQDAGTNKAACNQTSFTMDAIAPTELGAYGTWTYLPATASVIITDKNNPTTTVTVPADSTILFTWTISNPKCSADNIDTVRIYSYKKPIMRDAGSTKAACDQTTFTMDATAPTELGAYGTWSFTPATASVTIVNANDPKTSVTVPADSSILFTWTIKNPKCSADQADTVRITSYKKPVMRDAGSYKAACDQTTFTMDATAPTELGAYGTWSFTPATASVTIANANDPKTSVTVPADSSILFTWTIKNPKCSADQADTVSITSYKKPIMRDAGSYKAACDQTTFTMDATAPTELGASGTWTFVPATASVKITDIHDPKTTVTVPADSTILFTWKIANPKCSADNADTVSITSYKKPIMRDAGSYKAACDQTTFTMDATAPTELGATGTWTFVPVTASVKITDIHDPKTTVTVPADSTILFTWSISNPKCKADNADTVSITSYKKPIMRDAGSYKAACDQTIFTMDATAPTELGATGTWYFIPATASVKITDIHDPKTTVTVPADSTILFTWKIANPKCSADNADTVSITSYKKPIMRDAGSYKAACDQTTFTMDATAPTELGATGTWTFVPVTASVKITDIHDPKTTVTVPADSTILFTWSISNPKCKADNADTVSITSYKKPIMRDAGSYKAACDQTIFTMDATAPTELGATGTWYFIPATASVKITDIHDPKTTVTVPADSTILFTWKIANPKCSADNADTVSITSYKKPIMRDAGSYKAACDQTTFTMDATAPTELGATGTWTFVPATASVKITNIHDPKTTVTVPADSTILFTWKIANPKCSADNADTVSITSYKKPIMRDAGSYKAACDQTTFTMDATAPTELEATGTWYFTPATASVKITNIHDPKTTVTVPADSTILFTWKIANPKCSADNADTVSITSYKKPIMRDAGSYKAACDQTTFTMDATAPTELGATGTWTFVPATASVKITDIHDPKTIVTVPADSTILFTWKIANPKCSADNADTVSITSYKKPIMRDAGSYKAACDQTTFTMDATAPTELGATGTWTFVPVTASVKITDIHDPKTIVTVPADSTILFTWSISNPKCKADNADTVSITSYKKPIMRDAGSYKAACDQTTFTMDATAPTELGASGTWYFTPATASVKITDIHDPKTIVTVPADSTILFTWKIANPKCSADNADTVSITSYKKPIMRDAGSYKAACDQTTFTMDATAPTELGASGTWYFTPATASVKITNIHDPKTTVTVPADSTILFTWKIANPKCSADNADTVSITSYKKPIMRDAGSYKAACDQTTFTMDATAPTELGATGTWYFTPATASVKITNIHDPKTTVTVPADSTILFTWKIANPKCSADNADTVSITSYKKPIMRDAGSYKAACDQTTFTMDATAPTELGATGTWYFTPATASVKITNIHDPKTTVTVPADSTILFTWKIANPKCSADNADTVSITSYKKPIMRDAGSYKAACDQTTFTMDATAPTELGATGTWYFTPATASVKITDIHNPKTIVTVPADSTILFTWKIANPKCSADNADTVRITSYKKPIMRNAGTDKIGCEQTTFTMNATAPTELGAIGTWTFLPATANVKMTNVNDPKTSVTVPIDTVIHFIWTISNPKCAADKSDTVDITSYKKPIAAKAGPDQENCNDVTFKMNGNQPTGLNVKGTWTYPASTAGVNILNPNQYNTTVTVAAGMSVKLVWTISNGTCAATTDTVLLTNYATANKANAGPDQMICNNTGDFIMQANTPGVPTAKGTWTDISRIPGRAIIKSPNSPTTAVTVPVGDTVVLQWAIANGVCDTTFSRVTIINYKAAITANAGPDQEKCNTAADFIMKASQPGSSSATGTWTDISRIPGRATIKAPNDPLTAVTVPIGDTVILKWTVTNGTCTSTSSIVTLINYKKADDANAGPDQEMCNNTGDFKMAADPVSVPSAKGFWSIVKGNAVIKSINSPTSLVNINVGDTVTLRWTVTNGVCSASWDDVTLINYRMPVTANAGTNQEHCDDATFKMNASDPGVTGAKGTWVVTSNNASLIQISDINLRTATVTVPAGETAQLTWVVSNGVCAATSSSVTLINRKPILGNNITADQTVCITETPMAIRSNALSGGNGAYTYQWQQSTTSATGPFVNIPGATSDTYQPGTLAANTWYRRIVASGACIDNISNAVKITVITINPIVTSTPPAITTECEKGKDYTTLFGTPVFSHAPYDDEKLTITYNDATVVTSPCLSTITRTWAATDRCGRSVSASQTITIQDTKAPVFTTPAPADTTVDCDKVPAKTDLKANDGCAGEIIIPVVEVRQDIPGNCTNNYLLIRTWTAKDACNTGVTLKQVITVKDMTAPVFDMAAPKDTTVDCDKIPAGFNLTAKDNCTPGVITVTPKDSIARDINNCNSNYLIYRKWTAFDQCGNASAVQQIIHVQDTTKPVFSMPAPKDTVVDCDKVPAWPAITASDNCTANVQVFTTSKTVKLPGNCAGNYQEIRYWTATDDCGNKSVMQQTITVQDTTKPVFTVKPPADTTVSCDNIPAPATDVTVTDNCSTIGNGLTVSRRVTVETIPGACASNYRIIRTWIAKDACGNTSTITQVVTVKDTTRPVIMPAPADVVIYCQDKIPAPPVLTATDNCDNSFPKNAIYSEDPYVADICNGYTIVRRWTIMDACGNKANDVTQRVIVKPCAKPQLEATLPSNCSDNGRIALHKVGDVYMPTYTLVAVTPANAVTGLPRTQNNNVFNLNGATSASFIITDGRTGCSSDTVTYNINYIQKPMVNLGSDTTICGGNSLVLDAGAANFAYKIQWSTGATTQRININQAGTYWVNVSNGECATTDTIHVGLIPTPLVSIPDTTICRGQSVKLDAYVDGASYLWSNGSTASSILVSTQEQFWVKVMKSACITIDTIKVSVNPPPDISLSRDTAICPDQSIMLTVNSNGGRIQWQTGETSNSIVVNKPGGYWVAVSRDNCVVRDTVNVRMKPALMMDLGPDRNICPGGTITLDGTNPDAISYLWNDGDPNPVKQITQAGKYKLAVMDKYCQRVFMDSVAVNITGLPTVNLGRDTVMCVGETLVLRAMGTGISGVRWDNGSSASSLSVTNGGTYTVTVFNDCGSATDDITVNFTQCEPKPTIPNAFSPNGDGRNDVFRPVVRGQMFEYELRIFNRWGEMIFMTSDNHKGWDGKYKGVPVDVGTYVWWLTYKKVAGGNANVLKGEVTVVR
ncbi:gliding motility-associated C-terminal domain-containing protein [Chitinophaga eiseniae]|uniref:Gliding motility-associated C-terminal domain-containing protein n=1 Tax=Chitinophaga eiseniae TaxID=634771 RepID=A0A847SK50_9BACT|nr:gliding motility-associated C-terminal domain-containing protein [Chitinophaga eiseniae]NLR77766.1 gliding motility-associated C-terminal domain-containing protein [Chitinophaga eiseniae]